MDFRCEYLGSNVSVISLRFSSREISQIGVDNEISLFLLLL